MTDGAAKTLSLCDQSDKEIANAFENLTSRNPEKFWTSGQWMTEKRGGSDVRNGTETVAIPSEAEDGLSLDSRSADKELKAVTPKKSKACVTTFTKKVGA